MSMNKKLRREKREAEARGEVWTRPERKRAAKRRQKRTDSIAKKEAKNA